jgi:transcription elongation factor Elf1
MHHKDVAPSRLPSFFLPCPHCGHRMAISGVAPARLGNGAESNDLEDVTHSCVQCGTTLTRTIRPLSGDVHEVMRRL